MAENFGPADFGLERISVGGEIVTQGLKQRAERLFGSVRWLEGLGMTETWPVGGRLCEAGHLHFEVSQGLIEVQPLSGTAPAEAGEAGTLVVTPFAPYRETTLLLRYDTQDVVQVLPTELACSLSHLPASSASSQASWKRSKGETYALPVRRGGPPLCDLRSPRGLGLLPTLRRQSPTHRGLQWQRHPADGSLRDPAALAVPAAPPLAGRRI